MNLFEAALEVAPENRRSFIDDACGSDDETRHKLEAMLCAHTQSGPLDRTIDLDAITSGVRTTTSVPQRAGPYRILEEIGRGGMGVVYKAVDERLERHVALKFVTEALAGNPDRKRRLFREARAASSLDHPNICTVFDVGETERGELYIAMAYYEGETLGARLARSPLSIEETVSIALQVARALSCAHEAGIVHRDIKPSNILLTTRGSVKVLDFGVAKSSHSEDSSVDRRVGTVLYSAPEQLSAAQVDHRADIWSLGVVVYEMLTGRRPFEGPTEFDTMEAVLRHRCAPPSALRSGIPMHLDAAVLRALEKNVHERFSTVEEMTAALGGERIEHIRTAVAPPSFPRPMTSFIGREEEIAKVCGLLDESRIVTLTGPGGTGKTRLAIEVGRAVAQRYRDGVRFVGLAAARDEDAVFTAIAESAGCPLAGGRAAREQVTSALETKRSLLVLDNFEQVSSVAPAIAAMLSPAPELSVLITSRIALRFTGEREFAVPPLYVDQERAADDTSVSPAVQLFEDRARSLSPAFRVTTQNLDDVTEICARVDGLPLAIELAAARIKVLSPHALAARLGSRLDLLKSGAPDRPTRHQTLRQALAWSHDLLSESERAVFRRCGIFARTFTLEALEEVCAVFAHVSESTLDILEMLIDHSLVMRCDAVEGEPRFSMLETMREYAAECLLRSGEEKRAREAQVSRLLRLADSASAALASGSEQGGWISLLEWEHDDVRAVLDWLDGENRIEEGLKICTGIWRFWTVRGHIKAGLERMSALLEQAPDTLDPLLRARALNACGTLAHGSCDMPRARVFLEQSLALFDENGDKGGAAQALNNLAWIDIELGDFLTGRYRAEQALQLHESLGDLRGMAVALNNLGWIGNYAAQFDSAFSAHSRSIDLRRQAGDFRGAAFGLANLAWTEQRRGDYPSALAHLAESLEILNGIGDVLLEAWTRQVRAAVRYELGEPDTALEDFRAVLPVWRQAGNSSGLAFGLVYAALALVSAGRQAEALGMLAECESALSAVPQAWGIGQLYYARARLFASRGDCKLAIEEAGQAVGRLASVGDRRGLAACYELMAGALLESDRDRAREYRDTARRLREELRVAAPPCDREQIARLDRSLAD